MDTLTTIQFPSPSSLLQTPVESPTIPVHHPPEDAKSKTAQPKQKLAKSKIDGAIKPKQSKSRNGCITCKNKRLKCDEAKPTCQQCHKRNVECGGYKKDYKWRPFEETSFNAKAIPTSKAKKSSISTKDESPRAAHSPCESETFEFPATPKSLSKSSPPEKATLSLSSLPIDQYLPPQIGSYAAIDPFPDDLSSLPKKLDVFDASVLGVCSDETQSDERNEGNSSATHRSGYMPVQSDGICDNSIGYGIEHVGYDLALSATRTIKDEENDVDEDDIEEVIRNSNPITSDEWLFPYSAQQYRNNFIDFAAEIPTLSLQEPKFSPSSPEMLMLGFDKKTCGILSVRDGPTENPWRTAIYPLVHESPALYHAISSMTAFHSSKLQPALKVKGMEHMRESIRLLARDINKMRADIALASTLVLAFAESWDVHVTTGIKHLQGAKTFMSRALPLARQAGPDSLFAKRINFLCNIWVYMDVIARLTSVNVDEATDFDIVLSTQSNSTGTGVEIDPLMGCAATLFPLVGRVANLVRTVRKSSSNSIFIIQQANELKSQIESWLPPAYINRPEDETCEIADSLKTAEAYRWATLLYLHQAVPEIPSRSASQLAKKALVPLALVPIYSRTTIVQIYPLLAAGSEASTSEDRKWVTDRWIGMSQRMLIGNIDRCLEVVKEVWARRDRYQADVLRSQPPCTYMDEDIFSPSSQNSGCPPGTSQKLSPTWDLPGMRRPHLSTEHGIHAMISTQQDQNRNHFWHTELMRNQNDVASNADIPSPSLANYAFSVDEMNASSIPDWLGPLKYGNMLTEAGNFDSISNSAPGRLRKGSMELREELLFERTVRGNQHWVGVMKDWDWEVLLG